MKNKKKEPLKDVSFPESFDYKKEFEIYQNIGYVQESDGVNEKTSNDLQLRNFVDWETHIVNMISLLNPSDKCNLKWALVRKKRNNENAKESLSEAFLNIIPVVVAALAVLVEDSILAKTFVVVFGTVYIMYQFLKNKRDSSNEISFVEDVLFILDPKDELLKYESKVLLKHQQVD